jgi:hypothetical protein
VTAIVITVSIYAILALLIAASGAVIIAHSPHRGTPWLAWAVLLASAGAAVWAAVTG